MTSPRRRFKLNQMVWVYDENDCDYSKGQVTQLLKRGMMEVHFWEEDTGKPTTFANYHEDFEHVRLSRPKPKRKRRKAQAEQPAKKNAQTTTAERPAKKRRTTGARRKAAMQQQEQDEKQAKNMASALLDAAMQREKILQTSGPKK